MDPVMKNISQLASQESKVKSDSLKYILSCQFQTRNFRQTGEDCWFQMRIILEIESF
jgi:hypothetical protein